jgi:hypothetical protein
MFLNVRPGCTCTYCCALQGLVQRSDSKVSFYWASQTWSETSRVTVLKRHVLCITRKWLMNFRTRRFWYSLVNIFHISSRLQQWSIIRLWKMTLYRTSASGKHSRDEYLVPMRWGRSFWSASAAVVVEVWYPTANYSDIPPTKSAMYNLTEWFTI